MSDEPQMQSLEVHAQWVDIDQVPMLASNQLLAQVNEGEVTIAFGQLTPPAVVGTPEERQEQIEAIRSGGAVVPVRTVARIFMTPFRLRQVIDVLTETLERHELQERLGAEAADVPKGDQ
jgi:hypothetical protein